MRCIVDIISGLELAIHLHPLGDRVCVVLTWNGWPGLPYGDATGEGATEAQALANLAQSPAVPPELKGITAGLAAMAGYYEHERILIRGEVEQ